MALLGMLCADRPASAQGVFIRGDCDQNREPELTDAVNLLGYLYVGTEAPTCFDACDTDDSGELDISDAISLLSYLYRGGPAPAPPFPLEDPDPSDEDPLGCLNGRVLDGTLRVTPQLVIFHEVGQSRVVTVSQIPEGGDEVDLRGVLGLRFSSDAPAVAEVDADGVVHARGVGQTVLRARYLGVERVVDVYVLAGADGAPRIDITAPADGAVLTGPSALLSGTVSDPSAVVSYRESSGTDTPVPLRGRRFALSVDLVEGENRLTLTAEGTAGSSSASVTVVRVEPGSPEAVGPDGLRLPAIPTRRVDPPDTTPPAVAILEPHNGAALGGGPVEVTGTIDDPTATVRVQGVAAEVSGGSFIARGVRLVPGQNTIEAVAHDRVGNEARAVAEVTVDAEWPRIELAEPAGAPVAVVGTRRFTVTGTVEPRTSLVSVQGAPASVMNGVFSAELFLEPGSHDLVVSARLERNPSRRASCVRRVVVDTDPPVLEILHPPPADALSPSGYLTPRETVKIVGRVAERAVPSDHGETVSLSVNDGPVVEVRETFAVTAALQVGENRIELEARDARGNVARLELLVVRTDALEPRLTVLTGDGQTARAGELVFVPFTVSVTNGRGGPEPGVPVTFEVIGGSGRMATGGRAQRVLTDAAGRAAVSFLAGREAGVASEVVTASVPAYTGSPVAFSTTTLPRVTHVLVARGSREVTGEAGEEAEPVAVRLLDPHGNEIAGAPVTFQVTSGTARLRGAEQVTETTSRAGVAKVVPTLGEGVTTSTIEASAEGAEPVEFRLTGQPAGGRLATAVEGVVLDDAGQPVGGALVGVLAGSSGDPAVTTGPGGGFVLEGCPRGEVLLDVAPMPGHASLRRVVRVLGGRWNRLSAPLRVARLEDGDRFRRLRVSSTAPTVFTLRGLPRFRLGVPAGAARFAGGSRYGDVYVASPNLRALPERPLDGVGRVVPILILPLDVAFDPPARLALPCPGPGAGRPVRLVGYAGAAGFTEQSGARMDADGEAALTDPQLGVSSGGLYYFAVPGPTDGVRGKLAGRVELTLPWLNEVPARPESVVVGNNVFAHSGEFFLEETDLEIPGRGLSYRFRRRYESRHSFRGALGWNWEHEYSDRRLIAAIASGNIVRRDGAGRFDEYLLDEETGSFVSPLGVFSRLFTDSSGFFIERSPDGTRHRYYPLDGSVLAGRLQSITDRMGNTLRMQHDGAGRLVEVEDSLKRVVEYAYNGEDRIQTVTDFAGRVLTFTYDDEGDLVAVTTPAVTGTPNFNDFPDGRRAEYTYSSGHDDVRLRHNLMEIISPSEVAAGTRVPWLRNHYREDLDAPDVDRVVRQDWGGTNSSGVVAGGGLTIDYVDTPARGEPSLADTGDLVEFLTGEAGRTTYTNRRGHVTEIRYNGAGLPLALRVLTSEDVPRPRETRSLHPAPPAAPPWYETRYVWNVEGLLVEAVDHRGSRRVWWYDDGAPLRYGRGFAIREEHYPAPLADGEEKAPEITLRRFDPLYGRVVVEVAPNAHDPAEPLRLATRRYLDYQEGATLEELALEAGVSTAELSRALEHTGMVLGLGDLNGDGASDGARGNPVSEVLPPATLPDGSVEGAERLLTYNRFGQLESQTDATGRVVRYAYHSEADPEGDGDPRGDEGLDPSTGGYLASVMVDPDGFDGRAPLALTATFLQDALGNVVRRTDPEGHEVLHTYNALGEIVEEGLPPPLKYRRQYFYDADGRITALRVANLVPNAANTHFVVVDNPWLESNFTRDILGEVVVASREVFGGEEGPDQFVTERYRYDTEGALIRVIRPVQGTDEALVRDERGLVIGHTRGDGSPESATTWQYRDGNGNVVRAVDAADTDDEGGAEATEYFYDGWDRLIATRDPAGGVRVLQRAPGGAVVREAFLGSPGGRTPLNGDGNALLERCERRFDERGRLYERRRSLFGAPDPARIDSLLAPVVLVEQLTRDAEGRVVARRAPDGAEEEFVHDGAGRVVEERYGDLRLVRRWYDAAGRVRKEREETFSLEPVGPAGTEDPDYDPDGRLRRVTEAVHVYDPLGRRLATVDTLGGTWRARYNTLNQVVFSADANGPVIGIAAAPDLASVADLLSDEQKERINGPGNRLRASYDDLGRLVSVEYELRRDGTGATGLDDNNPYNIDALVTESFEWDPNGRLVAWTDDVGRRTEVDYDAAGRIHTKRLPGGVEEQFERDRDGHPRVIRRGGITFEQSFDALGRLVERRIKNDASLPLVGTSFQAFEYDGLSRLTLAVDDNSPGDPSDDAVVSRRHDSLGRLVEEAQGAFGYVWRHDANGRVVETRYADGRRVWTPRDASGGVSELRDEDGRLSAYSRLGSSLVVRQSLAGGVELTLFEKDDDEIPRLTGYDGRGAVVRHAYHAPDGEMLRGWEYGRDLYGNHLYERLLHTRDRRGDVWRYDSIYRVRLYLPDVFDPRVPPIDPVEKLTFQSDGSHNWRFVEVDQSRQFWEVNERDQVTRIDQDFIVYDDPGNLRATANEILSYDGLGRLRALRRAGSVVASYAYDAVGAEDAEAPVAGRRVVKHVDRPADGQPAGTLRFTYIGDRVGEEWTGGGQLLRQYLWAGDEDAAPAALLRHTSAASPMRYAVLRDGRNNPIAFLDRDGTLVESLDYDFLGGVKIRNASGFVVRYSAFGNALYFGGLVRDFETGFYVVGPRHFDPRVGRFLSPARQLLPRAPLRRNAYLVSGFPPLGGDILGGESPLRRRALLEPFEIRVPVDSSGTFTPAVATGLPGPDGPRASSPSRVRDGTGSVPPSPVDIRPRGATTRQSGCCNIRSLWFHEGR